MDEVGEGNIHQFRRVSAEIARKVTGGIDWYITYPDGTRVGGSVPAEVAELIESDRYGHRQHGWFIPVEVPDNLDVKGTTWTP